MPISLAVNSVWSKVLLSTILREVSHWLPEQFRHSKGGEISGLCLLITQALGENTDFTIVEGHIGPSISDIRRNTLKARFLTLHSPLLRVVIVMSTLRIRNLALNHWPLIKWSQWWAAGLHHMENVRGGFHECCHLSTSLYVTETRTPRSYFAL